MKQHIRTTLSSALIAAGCIAGTSAWAVTPGAAANDLSAPPAKPSASMTQGNEYGNAADKGADTNKVQPSQEAVQQRANEPSSSVLDDNAQRQHDRNQGSTPRPSADSAGTTHQGATGSAGGMSSDSSTGCSSGMSGGADTSDGSATTRDWNKIDADQDGSVSPQEMDNWLQKSRAPAGSTQQPAPQK
jgi:hypothetical protein